MPIVLSMILVRQKDYNNYTGPLIIVGILGGGQGGSEPQAISPELYSGWVFSPPLFMVVEVLQGTELKLRAWMTSWYEVLVWLCLSWCGCAGPSVWLWCVPCPRLISSGVGVRD